jgi:pyridoxal phosphate enzyme (YggS family)
MRSRAGEIAENLNSIKSRIAIAAAKAGRSEDEITLIAVTKTFPVSDIKILYDLGVHDFGENRDQEGSVKYLELPSDSNWHFQGQIQSNKLKSISNWAGVIHSIDDLLHAKKLDSYSDGKDIFIQVSLDKVDKLEKSPGRGGVSPDQLLDFLAQIYELQNLNVRGLMAVAPLDELPDLAFGRLKKLSESIVKSHPGAWQISAGMSNDFETAIAHGATHIRVGSQILGVR